MYFLDFHLNNFISSTPMCLYYFFSHDKHYMGFLMGIKNIFFFCFKLSNQVVYK